MAPKLLTTAEICQLYELSGVDAQSKKVGHDNVFVVGSFHDKSERIAVASQQTRAINLVYSLVKEDRLRKGTKLCVIGGGVAGLTAAAYAMRQEVSVTVLESRVPLWNLRGCRTRWLHPNLFRHWPDPEWQCTATRLPVMNWYAGYASDVGDLLWSKFLAHNAHQLRDRQHPNADIYIVNEIRVEPEGSRLNISWQEVADSDAKTSRRADVYDALIVAVGFGSELRGRDTEGSVYWLDDTLERERPDRAVVNYLISGSGDGGLTDLLRIRLKDFRHHHLRDSLLNIKGWESDLTREYHSILTRDAADEDYDPTDALKDLANRFIPNHLLRQLRPTTTAVLTNLGHCALKSPAWRVSRFLAAGLLARDPDHTCFLPGRAETVACCSTAAPGDHPEYFETTFGNGDKKRFDAVVTRHGPKIRLAADELKKLGFDPADIQVAREKWQRRVREGVQTDELMFQPDNDDLIRRSHKTVVTPALGGRTVVSMLSRLVASVAPEDDVDARPEDEVDIRRITLVIRDPLVFDETANMIAPIAESVAYAQGSGGCDGSQGWQLGAEIERRSAIAAIVAADEFLKMLWSRVADFHVELERAWVLPRPPWLPAGKILQHTRVGRHWGEWRLRYHQTSDKAQSQRPQVRQLKTLIYRAVDSISAAAETCKAPERLGVVDLSESGVRVAYCHEGGALPERLAREMGAEFLYISKASDAPGRGILPL